MEILHYLPDYQILICKPCQYAISPSRFQTHMRTHHRDTAGFRTHKELLATRAIIDANYLWKDPSREPVPLPPPDSPPIPNLPLKRGLRCLECLHICCTPEGIRNHLYRAHPHLRRPRSRPSALGSQADQTQPRWEETFCQRFFVTGSQSGYFAVLPPVPDIELRSQNARPPKASNALSPEESMRA